VHCKHKQSEIDSELAADMGKESVITPIFVEIARFPLRLLLGPANHEREAWMNTRSEGSRPAAAT
jgi:hypothetical protein